MPLSIKSFTFGDGTTIQPARGSITVLVGPNNAGKSRSLRDIQDSLRYGPSHPTVLNDIEWEGWGDAGWLENWLRRNGNVTNRQGQGEMVALPGAGELQLRQVILEYGRSPQHLQTSSGFFVLHAGTEQRLGLVASQPSIDPLNQQPTAALQALYFDKALEDRLSDASRRAFGRTLTVNRVAGPQIHLHVGDVNVEGLPLPTNLRYREALEALPLIQGEGDGMRSYVGLLLALTCVSFPVVLIDEPEAFLHPPQERQLGRELIDFVDEETQLVVATHSADFLEGLLSSGRERLTVVRLQRDAGVKAKVLNPSELLEVWNDPILRYAGLLDALFHKGAVLCESDADCLFYEATLDTAIAKAAAPAHDLLFTHTGGKHRLPTAVSALRAIDVPVCAVADMDVLRESDLLGRLVVALGGQWENYEREWNIVAAAIAGLRGAPSVGWVQEKVGEALEGQTGSLTKETADQVRQAVKSEDGWRQVKSGGVTAVPQGDAYQAATKLLRELRGLGLFVVNVGELERWEPDIPGHGPAWAASAIEKRRHEEAGPHAQFVVDIARSLGCEIEKDPSAVQGSADESASKLE